MKKYLFYKENERWYVDLPEWTGSKADLEMVCGADRMLNDLSNNGDKIELIITLIPLLDMDIVLTLRDRVPALLGGGANYKSNEVDYNIWLCDVTKFVFGKFPKTIYISKI